MHGLEVCCLGPECQAASPARVMVRRTARAAVALAGVAAAVALGHVDEWLGGCDGHVDGELVMSW